MPKYRATFYWWMSKDIEVEADTEEQAKAQALELSKAISTETEGEYVTDSFELGCIDLVDSRRTDMKRRKRMVVIEVRGGLVAEVYTDDPALSIVLIDWDTEGSEGDPCTFVVSNEDGHEYVASAADYPTPPLDQMPQETREAVALATSGHQG